MRIRDLLDPDRDWRSWATVEHYTFCIVLCALFDFVAPLGVAFALTVWTGAIYEAGQTDATYSLRDSSGRRYAGQPGYGFSLMDMAANTLGAMTWMVARLFLARVFA